MKIEVTIPDNKLTEFYGGFLHIFPIPKDDGGKAKYTKSAWIKLCTKKYLIRAYKSGKRRKAHDELKVTYDISE